MHKLLYRLPLSILISSVIGGCSSIISTNNNWMSDNKSQIQNKNIGEIRIPGSHYANAYNIRGASTPVCRGETNSLDPSRSATIVRLVNKDKSITIDQLADYFNIENEDIYDQLNQGIRYLDLQVCLQDNVFYTSNYFLTPTLDDVFTQVISFNKNHPNEIILIDFDHKIWDEDGNINAKNIPALHALIENKLGKLLIKKTSLSNLTFNKIWKDDGRIILMTTNKDLAKYNNIWDKETLVKVNAEPTWTTIKKLTNIQLNIDNIESNMALGMSIVPIYSSFNPQKNTTQEIGNNFNNHLVMDYLYSLPESTPLNIVVGDNEYIDELVKFSTYMYKTK